MSAAEHPPWSVGDAVILMEAQMVIPNQCSPIGELPIGFVGNVAHGNASNRNLVPVDFGAIGTFWVEAKKLAAADAEYVARARARRWRPAQIDYTVGRGNLGLYPMWFFEFRCGHVKSEFAIPTDFPMAEIEHFIRTTVADLRASS